MSIELQLVGQMDNSKDHTLESSNRVYSPMGLSPALTTCGGGNLEPKILGGISSQMWGKQYHQQDRVYDGSEIAMCHPANIPEGSYKYMTEESQEYRIRKLTPCECWKLMGFDLVDFQNAEKVNSKSQLYKQAGNSIVVNVLEAIFGQMI